MLALSAQAPGLAAPPVRVGAPPLRRLAPPVLDQVTGELRVPFEGLPPVYRVTRLAPPRRFVIDFDRAALVKPVEGRVSLRPSWLRSWRLEQAADGHARLVLVLSTLAPHHLLSARRGRTLVLEGTLFVPPVLPPRRALPAAPASPLAPTPAPVVLASPEPPSTPEPTPEPTPGLSRRRCPRLNRLPSRVPRLTPSRLPGARPRPPLRRCLRSPSPGRLHV